MQHQFKLFITSQILMTSDYIAIPIMLLSSLYILAIPDLLAAAFAGIFPLLSILLLIVLLKTPTKITISDNQIEIRSRIKRYRINVSEIESVEYGVPLGNRLTGLSDRLGVFLRLSNKKIYLPLLFKDFDKFLAYLSEQNPGIRIDLGRENYRQKYRRGTVINSVAFVTFFSYFMLRIGIPQLLFGIPYDGKHFPMIWHQLGLWNFIIGYLIALIAGLVIGLKLTEKARLAAFYSVLPVWVLNGLVTFTIMTDGLPYMLLDLLKTSPVFLFAVIGVYLAEKWKARHNGKQLCC